MDTFDFLLKLTKQVEKMCSVSQQIITEVCWHIVDGEEINDDLLLDKRSLPLTQETKYKSQ